MTTYNVLSITPQQRVTSTDRDGAAVTLDTAVGASPMALVLNETVLRARAAAPPPAAAVCCRTGAFDPGQALVLALGYGGDLLGQRGAHILDPGHLWLRAQARVRRAMVLLGAIAPVVGLRLRTRRPGGDGPAQPPVRRVMVVRCVPEHRDVEVGQRYRHRARR